MIIFIIIFIFVYFRFENLRIRRLKKGDTTGRGAMNKQPVKQSSSKGARSKQDEKVAYLLFTATVRTMVHKTVELQALSQAIYLSKCINYNYYNYGYRERDTEREYYC